MKLNSEFTEDVGICHHEVGPTFTRSALKNERMLRITVDLGLPFIRNTGEQVYYECPFGEPDKVIDIREANIRDLVSWFEKHVREWVAGHNEGFEWP